MELPSLLNKLANFRSKNSANISTAGELGGGRGGTLTRAGHSGTLTRYSNKEDHLYYGPVKNIGDSDRDMSSSSPVLLEMYDHVKVDKFDVKNSNYSFKVLNNRSLTEINIPGPSRRDEEEGHQEYEGGPGEAGEL